MANKILRLDITKTPELTPIVYGRVGDGLIQTIDVYVTNNGEPFNLTGYTLKFEGNTSGNRSFIQDTENIKVKDLAKGYFTYTFPTTAFSVAGKYEHAYFSFTKGTTRESTSDFDIQIFYNADITAEEAHTVINEYDKLVEELNEIFLKANTDLQEDFTDFKTTYDKKYNDYVSDLTKKVTEAQNKIDILNKNYEISEKKITELENRLQELINNGLLKMEDVAFFLQGKTSVTIDGKVVKVDEVIPTFTFLTKNHYTKTETDSKYVNLTAAQTIGGKKTFSTQPYYNTYKLMSENDAFSKTEINKMLTSFYSQRSAISKTANLNEITVFGIYDLIDFTGTNGPELGIALNGKLEVYYNFDEKNIVMQRITIGKPGTTDTGMYVRFGNIQSTITWTSWSSVGAQLATKEEAEAGLNNTKAMTPLRVFQSIAKWIEDRFINSGYLLDKTHPVGSIYISVNKDDPSKVLGGGTWERFAKGQVLVGVNEDDTDFSTSGKTGGEKAHKLTVAELANHTHKQLFSSGATGIGDIGRSPNANKLENITEAAGITATGGDQPHNNLQPYTTVYIWKRTN